MAPANDPADRTSNRAKTPRRARKLRAAAKTATPRATKSASTSASPTQSALTCPECGRTFGRPSALGAHRRQAHGVVGSSARARASSERRRKGSTGKTSVPASPARGRGRGGAQPTTSGGTIDRNGLLRALFPNGIPADVNTIRSVNRWLDDAEHWLDEAARIAGNA